MSSLLVLALSYFRPDGFWSSGEIFRPYRFYFSSDSDPNDFSLYVIIIALGVIPLYEKWSLDFGDFYGCRPIHECLVSLEILVVYVSQELSRPLFTFVKILYF